jgi:hypothetical protein
LILRALPSPIVTATDRTEEWVAFQHEGQPRTFSLCPQGGNSVCYRSFDHGLFNPLFDPLFNPLFNPLQLRLQFDRNLTRRPSP